MARISIKGVVIGGLTDVFLSFLLGMALIVLLFVLRIPRDEIHAAISAASRQQGMLWDVQLGIGFLCSALGGFVAAWIARRNELLNGVLSSFLCISIGLFEIATSEGRHPVALQLVLLAASPLVSLLGGYLRLRWRLSQAETA